ncbi:hypothetical protein B0H13DRAFT_2124965, partial [Mycena leptocephala]
MPEPLVHPTPPSRSTKKNHNPSMAAPHPKMHAAGVLWASTGKQTHPPCPSRILPTINCRSLPRMRRLFPGCFEKKKKRKTERSTHLFKHPRPHPRTRLGLPSSLTLCSAAVAGLAPARSRSFSLCPFPPIHARAYPPSSPSVRIPASPIPIFV